MESITSSHLSSERALQVQVGRMFADLQPEPEWSFAECTTRETTRRSHGYHRYPAKFIPQLVDKLLDEYVSGRDEACVNDPFMGSGTTLVCAIERGFRAIGTDVNEVACLITKAKVTPIAPQRLTDFLAGWIPPLERWFDTKGGEWTFLGSGERGEELETLVPQTERLDFWFPPKQKRDLGVIFGAIRRVEDEDIRTFLLCCFSHILKNCSLWASGSTKPTRSRTKRPAEAWPAFLRHLRRMVRRNAAFWAAVPPGVREDPHAYVDVRCQDARRQPWPDASADILITSSPYVTSYEYADLHQLTALWLSGAQDLRAFRAKFIGTGTPLVERPLCIQSPLGRTIAQALRERDERLGLAVGYFFMDMEETFREGWRILKPGARACYVIGNTRLKGVEVLNAQVFAEGLLAAGFVLERVILRKIPSKILPQTRDLRTGRFTSPPDGALHLAYK